MENLVNVITNELSEDAKRQRNKIVVERCRKQILKEETEEENESDTSSQWSDISTPQNNLSSLHEDVRDVIRNELSNMRRTLSTALSTYTTISTPPSESISGSSPSARESISNQSPLSPASGSSSSSSSASPSLAPNQRDGVKTGYLRFYHGRRGYGFIVQDDGGPDAFFHRSNAPSLDQCTNPMYLSNEVLHKDCWHDNPLWGQSVEYGAERSTTGRYAATNVTGPNGASLLLAHPDTNRQNQSLNSGLAFIHPSVFD